MARRRTARGVYRLKNKEIIVKKYKPICIFSIMFVRNIMVANIIVYIFVSTHIRMHSLNNNAIIAIIVVVIIYSATAK